MASGGKGGGSGATVNPYQAAQADWLFNRPNVFTPTQSTVNTFPGQTPPTHVQTGFNPGGLTQGAQNLFGPSINQSPTPPAPSAPANPTTQPVGGQANALASIMMGSSGQPANPMIQTLGGASGQSQTATAPGQQPPPGQNFIPRMPTIWQGSEDQWTQFVNAFYANKDAFMNSRTGQYFHDPSGAIGLTPDASGGLYGRSGKTWSEIMNNLINEQRTTTGGTFPQGMPTSPGTITTTLPPALQALQNAQTTTQANTLADVIQRQNANAAGALPGLINGLNTNGMQQLPSNPQQFTNSTIASMYNLGSQQLDRSFGRNYDIIQQDLANKGLAYPGEAASRQMGDFLREDAQARQNLALNSVLAGGQEATRSLQDLMSIRGQQTGEQMSNAQLASNSRLQQMNELYTLMGLNGPQGSQNPQFSPFDTAGAFGLQQSGVNARDQANATIKGGNTAAGGSLASALTMLAFM